MILVPNGKNWHELCSADLLLGCCKTPRFNRIDNYSWRRDELGHKFWYSLYIALMCKRLRTWVAVRAACHGSPVQCCWLPYCFVRLLRNLHRLRHTPFWWPLRHHSQVHSLPPKIGESDCSQQHYLMGQQSCEKHSFWQLVSYTNTSRVLEHADLRFCEWHKMISIYLWGGWWLCRLYRRLTALWCRLLRPPIEHLSELEYFHDNDNLNPQYLKISPASLCQNIPWLNVFAASLKLYLCIHIIDWSCFAKTSTLQEHRTTISFFVKFLLLRFIDLEASDSPAKSSGVSSCEISLSHCTNQAMQPIRITCRWRTLSTGTSGLSWMADGRQVLHAKASELPSAWQREQCGQCHQL